MEPGNAETDVINVINDNLPRKNNTTSVQERSHEIELHNHATTSGGRHGTGATRGTRVLTSDISAVSQAPRLAEARGLAPSSQARVGRWLTNRRTPVGNQAVGVRVMCVIVLSHWLRLW